MHLLSSPLLTDLYQLTMLQAYFAGGMNGTAVFELFVRKLPEGRNFFMAAGLEQALAFIGQLRFTDEELQWIEASGLFRPDFARRLSELRFTGDVHAIPEGTVFFPNEPVLRVTAPLPEAQLLETRVLNLIHLETVIASKAARVVLAAEGKRLIDFGLRRSHGAEAGLLAARAAYLAGFEGTSTVYAGCEWGIPVFGTMAHSFVQAHRTEAQAFERFIEVFPDNAVLLIDTYDTVGAAHKVAEISRALAARGIRPKGVRLDSGNLAQLSREVRAVLDAADLRDAFIFASGNLDEYRIAGLLAQGAPIDAFGVGSSLVTSSDAPVLDAVYKLQEYDGTARRKRSPGKATWPGRKQVYRRCDADGRVVRDLVTLETEPGDGEALLEPVMRNGRRTAQAPSLQASRTYARSQLDRLPVWLRTLSDSVEPYRVEISPSLVALAETLDRASSAPA